MPRLRRAARPSRTRLATWLAGIMVVGAVASIGLAWVAARSLMMPRRRTPARSPADLGLTFETIELAGADDVSLAGWWIPAHDPRGTLVLVHGFRSSRDEMLDHAPYLHEAGFDVLLYDARACGLSGGQRSTLGWREQADLHAVIDQVVERSPGRPVIVMGHSLGAAVAVLEGADDPRVAAFVLEAPFTAIEEVVDRSFRHFTRPSLPPSLFAPVTVAMVERRLGQRRTVVRPIDAIERLAPRPVLLVSGRHDPFVYPDDARRLSERIGPSCSWWLIPEAAHPGGDLDPYRTAPDEYQRRVLELLEAAVGGTDRPVVAPSQPVVDSRKAGSSVA